LWELCAGRRLYKGNDQEMLEQARNAIVPTLPARGLPDHARLVAILDRALARDPATRFQSAQEMLAELETYALSAQLMASQLRFGSFLSGHFGEQIVALRRERERAAEASLPPDRNSLRAAKRVSEPALGANVRNVDRRSPPHARSSEASFDDEGSLRPSLARRVVIALAIALFLLALWLRR
jgi:serine/threonine protein kinase